MELLVWIVSLLSVLLVGWAWGRSSRRVVVVNFPEFRSIDRIKPTAGEVAVALRATNDEETA